MVSVWYVLLVFRNVKPVGCVKGEEEKGCVVMAAGCRTPGIRLWTSIKGSHRFSTSDSTTCLACGGVLCVSSSRPSLNEYLFVCLSVSISLLSLSVCLSVSLSLLSLSICLSVCLSLPLSPSLPPCPLLSTSLRERYSRKYFFRYLLPFLQSYTNSKCKLNNL